MISLTLPRVIYCVGDAILNPSVSFCFGSNPDPEAAPALAGRLACSVVVGVEMAAHD
jgi:hypothetical protein